jgi:hypothetical protein
MIYREILAHILISNNEMKFHHANLLASQHGRAYTRFCLLHLLLWWIKPGPQALGLFFVRARFQRRMQQTFDASAIFPL